MIHVKRIYKPHRHGYEYIMNISVVLYDGDTDIRLLSGPSDAFSNCAFVVLILIHRGKVLRLGYSYTE